MKEQNVIIIGAPRSGTNMLRDVLTSFSGVGTWPCDEINYIWRHGNLTYPSDEIDRGRATPKVSRYVRAKFDAMRSEMAAPVLIEKTCANSLRVPFVDEIVPDAKFIFIYRDGIDATGSAKLRWTAELNFSYILEKVRFVPALDLPFYGLRYSWNRIYRLFSSEKRLAFWGPKLDGMEEILASHTLNEVCAIQWQRCVESSLEAFESYPANRLIRVKYEDFVTSPVKELQRILDFLDIKIDPDAVNSAVEKVSAKSVGKGRSALTVDDVNSLEQLVGSTLRKLGYGA